MVIKLLNRETEGELFLEGRLDSAAAKEVQEIFESTAERFDNVVLDMGKLEYISSAGLRLLKLLHMAMKKKNGELKLRNVNRMVMEVFEMTGFVSLLNIE